MGLLMTSLEHSTRQLTESSPLYRQAEVQGHIFHVANANCRLYVSASYSCKLPKYTYHRANTRLLCFVPGDANLDTWLWWYYRLIMSLYKNQCKF